MPRRARGARAVQHPAPSSRPVEFLRALRDRAPPDYAPSHTALRVCPLRRSNSRGWRSSYGTVPCNPVPARRCRCRLPAGALQNVRPASRARTSRVPYRWPKRPRQALDRRSKPCVRSLRIRWMRWRTAGWSPLGTDRSCRRSVRCCRRFAP